MVAPMAEGKDLATEIGSSRRNLTLAVGMVDFGTSPLVLAAPPAEATEIVDFVGPASPEPRRARPGIVRRIAGTVFGFIAWLVRSLFGIACLILLLAVIAAIPVVNFLA